MDIPNKKYIELKTGDIIKEGDEFLGVCAWMKFDMLIYKSCKYDERYYCPARRPIKKLKVG